MTYLLDTNACIRVLNASSEALLARFRKEGPTDIALSSVVLAELRHGARKSPRPASNLRLLDRFAEPLVVLPFDVACADHYGDIRSTLERNGTPIGPNDLLVAATARAGDLVLVTNNTREFGRVVGLRIEDWEGP